jgi:hypothetical protein
VSGFLAGQDNFLAGQDNFLAGNVVVLDKGVCGNLIERCT